MFKKAKHLIFLALLSVSCSKPDNQQSGEENFDQHPTWTDDSTNNFWDKQHGDGLQLDTVWDGDTTINF